jgi:transcriptional regulator with XRE-family HTH domain
MNVENTLIQNIKHLRKLAGLTQAQLAERIGKSHSYIRQFESGQTPPSYNLIHDISEALGVSISVLFSENEAENNVTPINTDFVTGLKNLQENSGTIGRLAQIAPDSAIWRIIENTLNIHDQQEAEKVTSEKKNKKA